MATTLTHHRQPIAARPSLVQLKKLGACKNGIRFVRRRQADEAAYLDCRNADWLLWLYRVLAIESRPVPGNLLLQAAAVAVRDIVNGAKPAVWSTIKTVEAYAAGYAGRRQLAAARRRLSALPACDWVADRAAPVVSVLLEAAEAEQAVRDGAERPWRVAGRVIAMKQQLAAYTAARFGADGDRTSRWLAEALVVAVPFETVAVAAGLAAPASKTRRYRA